MKTNGPIVFATDFSLASRGAFRAAVDAARRRGAALVIAHAAPHPNLVIAGGRASGPYRALADSIRCHAERQLRGLVRHARMRGVNARSIVLEGVPSAAIVSAARRERAQLVVVGTHGRTGFRRLTLGSVAARVVALAACPVLTVPAHGRARAEAACP